MSRNPLKLDEEELQILGDFERGEFESIQHFRAEKRSLEAAARRTLQKDKRINIRISSRDLEKLQKRAVMEGIPYQTLIASTLHKFVTGKLKEARLTLRCTGSSPSAGLPRRTLRDRSGRPVLIAQPSLATL